MKLGGESGVVVKKVLIAANLKMDGMLLGQGGAVHTGSQEVLGFVNPVKADEAERVLQMSDADREAWNAGNVEHLLQERDHAVVRRDRVVQLDARPLASAQRKV